MASRVADSSLLIECARVLARMLDAPIPDEIRILEVIDEIVDKRSVIANVERGLITRDEAVALLLARFHSELLQCVSAGADSVPWENRDLLDAVKRGIFGPSVVE